MWRHDENASAFSLHHYAAKGSRCCDLNTAYQHARSIPTSFLSSPNMSEGKHPLESDESNPIEAREQSVDVINERKLLRKIDLRILPGLAVLLLLSFLDQGNGKIFFFLFLPCIQLIFFQSEMLVLKVCLQTYI